LLNEHSNATTHKYTDTTQLFDKKIKQKEGKNVIKLIILIIIMYYNKNFNGKYGAIFGPEFLGHPAGGPDYRCSNHRKPTLFETSRTNWASGGASYHEF
jgi:hypothetical protein